MLYPQLLDADNGIGGWWSTHTGSELLVVLQKSKNNTQWYDEQINTLEKTIAEIKNIIVDYTPYWAQHQSLYNTKMETIKELQTEYERLRWENMSDPERQEFEDQKRREAEMWQHIFDGMWFGGEWMRGDFASEDDYFEHYQQEQKNKADAHYVKKNMEEVSGELVEQLKNLSIKILYRRISLALHGDRLAQNPQVAPYQDYVKYLHGVHQDVINARQKEDKATMIVIIQEAGIRYEDPNFILASYEDFKNIAVDVHKKNLIKELQDRLQSLKMSYVYVFYIKHTTGETQKELRELEDKIQELEDLIASYSPQKNHE